MQGVNWSRHTPSSFNQGHGVLEEESEDTTSRLWLLLPTTLLAQQSQQLLSLVRHQIQLLLHTLPLGSADSDSILTTLSRRRGRSRHRGTPSAAAATPAPTTGCSAVGCSPTAPGHTAARPQAQRLGLPWARITHCGGQSDELLFMRLLWSRGRGEGCT